MPAPPFWNQSTALGGLSFTALWKPQIPLWNVQVPPTPQSAAPKHCFPGVGPPVQRPPPLYSHTGFELKVGLTRLNVERRGNQPPSLRSKFHGTLSTPGVGPVAEARIPRSRRPLAFTSSPVSRMLLS